METLANQGILTRTQAPEEAGSLSKFLGRNFKAGSGRYRLSEDIEKQIAESDMSANEFFQKQFDNDYQDASQLAQYLDQVAYTTQGQFFQKDLFGNPTSYSKYVDRQGNIKPDALEQWKQFGQEDKRGVLKMFDKQEDDQGTQRDSQETSVNKGLASLPQQPPGRTYSAPDPKKPRDDRGRRLAVGSSNLLLG